MSQPTTEKIRKKSYACRACGHEKQIETNHYGECYSWGDYNRCPACGPKPPDPKHPSRVDYPPTTWVCKEQSPAGLGVPEKWTTTTLGELLTTTKSKNAKH